MKQLTPWLAIAALIACQRSTATGEAQSGVTGVASQGSSTTVDTTKDYYEDGEAPEFQVQITNGGQKEVPWAAVPELNRYIVEWDNPPGPKPRVRVPIVEVTTTSVDRNMRPVPLANAYRYDVEEVGLNPKHRIHHSGGTAH